MSDLEDLDTDFILQKRTEKQQKRALVPFLKSIFKMTPFLYSTSSTLRYDNGP